MNTLSWLIYAAEVSDRASTVCGLLAVVFFFVGGVAMIVAFVAAYSDDSGRGPYMSKLVPWTVLPLFLLIEVTFMAASVALPSKATIYLIAASEAGETVVTSPDAIEMMGDLKAIIKKRLKDELAAE